MGIKRHHTGNKVESVSVTCSLHLTVQLWNLDIEGIWQKEALGVWNVSPQKNTGCVQERQAEEWRHQVVPWTIQECDRRSATSSLDVLRSCLQDGSSSVPIHYSVWENPWLQTCWQAEEEMVGRSKDWLRRAGTVYVPSCSLCPGSCSLEKDVRRAAEAHPGVAKAISSSKFK